MSAERPKLDLLDYWRTALALYVTEKRSQSGKAQKEVGASRKTISSLENFTGNSTLRTMLSVMSSIDGDISEAFRSHVPKALHGQHQALHEMLQRILETENSEAVTGMRCAIRNAFEIYVKNSK